MTVDREGQQDEGSLTLNSALEVPSFLSSENNETYQETLNDDTATLTNEEKDQITTQENDDGEGRVQQPQDGENGEPEQQPTQTTQTPPATEKTQEQIEQERMTAESDLASAMGGNYRQPPAQQPQQPATTQTTQPQQTVEVTDQQKIQQIMSRPVVQAEFPKAENYQLQDGRFNIEQYMRDTFDAYTIQLQQQLVNGTLAALQYKTLQGAMRGEYEQMRSSLTQQQESGKIVKQLTDTFPRLVNDKQLREAFQTMIMGEKARREQMAQTSGQPYQPLQYEDYVDLLKNVLGNIEAAAKTQAPIERQPGGPVIATPQNGRPADPVEDAVSGMEQVGRRTSLF